MLPIDARNQGTHRRCQDQLALTLQRELAAHYPAGGGWRGMALVLGLRSHQDIALVVVQHLFVEANDAEGMAAAGVQDQEQICRIDR